MKEINPGECVVVHGNPLAIMQKGEMTLRDYFAAKAMQVFINNPETEWADDVRDAYDVADKMLKERNKE